MQPQAGTAAGPRLGGGRHAARGCGGYRRHDVAEYALVFGCLMLASATGTAGIVLLVVLL
jgi:hypothetical protein